jgi:putative intracellular protease/amidase
MRLITMTEYKERIAEGMTAVLIFDGMELLDMAGPWEVLAKQSTLKLFTVSPDGKPINTMGLKMTPDYSVANAPDFTYLVVPGGNVEATAEDERVQAWLKEHAPKTKQILSICTGAFILAEVGLLDGKEATTYHTALGALARDYPKIKVRPELRYVDNGHIITSAGISAGTDAAFYMVEKLFGRGQAQTTALRIEYDWNPNPEYVRARFADMVMPNIRLPEGANYRWLENDGDEQQWTKTGVVTFSGDMKAVTTTIDQALESGGWQKVAAETDLNDEAWPQGKVSRWQGEKGVSGDFRYAIMGEDQIKVSVSIRKP